jgi:hypothetical protein
MSLTFAETDVPLFSDPIDEAPETVMPQRETNPSGLACEVCGVPLVYAGRGRKPKFCDAHRKSPAGKKMSSGTKNESLARQAAAALAQLNGLACIGLMVVGFPATAGAISERNEDFENQAYNALLTDPALCATILKAGATSGKAALIIAYGMLGVSVAPVAVGELRERRALRDTEE